MRFFALLSHSVRLLHPLFLEDIGGLYLTYGAFFRSNSLWYWGALYFISGIDRLDIPGV
jgi:hypothetical protein